MVTLQQNIQSLTQVELTLLRDIVGPDNDLNDWGTIHQLKLWADSTTSQAPLMLFKKIVKDTKYERLVNPILYGDCGKLGKMVNKYYFEEYDNFITIVSALAYKNKHWLKNILHDEYSSDWGEKYTKEIVQSFGEKDWLTIVLFCTDELTGADNAIETYMKAE